MGCARYVGRIGALAVALGVGLAVVTTPGVAWADEPNNSDTPAKDAEDTTGNPVTPSPGSGGDNGDDHDTGTQQQTTTTTTTTTGSSTTTVIGGGSTPTVTFGNSGSIVVDDTHTVTTQTPESSTPSTLPSEQPIVVSTAPTSTVLATTPPVIPGSVTPTAGPSTIPVVLVDPNASNVQGVNPFVAPSSANLKAAPVTGTEGALVSTVGTNPPVTSKLLQANAISTLDVHAPVVAVAPPPTLFDTLLAVPVSIISTGLNLMSLALANVIGPGAPANSPILWTLLAFVRRQFDQTFNLPEIPIMGTTALTAPNADGYQLGTMFNVFTTGRGSGQTDSSGNLYVPMGKTLFVYGPDNQLIKTATLPFVASDVAPGPDGAYIYAVDNDLAKDNPCADCKPMTPVKLVRAADGGYYVDPTFKLDSFQYGQGAKKAAEGLHIATDDDGNLYVADGIYTQNIVQQVLVYDPTGHLVTRFGDSVVETNSYEVGKFRALGGIAVSSDGSSVFTTEVNNSRVQRWDRQANGTYVPAAVWGSNQLTDPNHTGGGPDGLNAPFDIGLDAAGDVYVISTTDGKIVKYDRNGNKITQMYVGSGRNPLASTSKANTHGLAVTDRGDAFSTQTGLVMLRA